MLLLSFLSVLEDNYSLQVTLLDYQYQKDYENLNSAPAQELISKFVAEVIKQQKYKQKIQGKLRAVSFLCSGIPEHRQTRDLSDR